MDDTLNKLLLRTLPDTKKKPRKTNKEAKRVVTNSVKGKRKGISGEQGFRNYLKYTDPLLQKSDESSDKSKLADDLEKIINLINPTMKTKVKEYIRTEKIVNADVGTEVMPVKKNRNLSEARQYRQSTIEEWTTKAKADKEQQKWRENNMREHKTRETNRVIAGPQQRPSIAQGFTMFKNYVFSPTSSVASNASTSIPQSGHSMLTRSQTRRLKEENMRR